MFVLNYYKSRKFSFSLLIVFILSALIFSFEGDSALAMGYGGIGGRPAYPDPKNPRTQSIFVYTLEPGTTKNDGVLLVNNTDKEKTLMVYAVDSVVSSGGAFACRQMNEPKKDVGRWISLSKSEVTLQPGKNEIVPFTIKVPKEASVGEHNGCIIIQEKKEKKENQKGMVLTFRTGLRVAVTVPGKIVRKLKIENFQVEKRKNGNFLLRPQIRNLGNVSIDTDVKVITRYFFGLILAQHGGQFPILRGKTSDWNFELKKPFWGGWYKSQLIATYDQNPEASIGIQSGKSLTTLKSKPIYFFSPPTPLALSIEIVVLLLIIFLIFLLVLAIKRKKWIQNQWQEYQVKPEDDIKKIAEKFGLSWKLLARVNKLQPPYALKPGDTIKVPPKPKKK